MANENSLDATLLSQQSAPPIEPSPEVPSATAAVSKPKSIILLAIILLCVYLIVGVLMYTLLRKQFSGDGTNLFVDALYFSIVTMCTVGYGDIVPLTLTTKILTIVLVTIGVLFLDFLLNRVVNHVLDLQEKAILARIKTPCSRNRAFRDHIVDVVNGRIRIKWKLRLAFCGVFFCVGVGTLFLCLYEKLDFVDSVYLSVISVTTVGYGDKTFKTLIGRVFAVFWLLFSSIAMASLFFYFAEKRIDGAIMKLPTTTR
ncbi:unnamed protein product [Microthlaspi erraticum]|uniref:Potassium channel domain-containing protein n=1 Tax=Microthlaspi erraticum TaxID=1685480 RepID=A0A6D2KH48_9BRAS|nr:unnamed protein product [Microthlaspi erraticum]